MLTCVACSKQLVGGSLEDDEAAAAAGTPTTRHAVGALTAQIKDMALKASGAYLRCKPRVGAPDGRNHHRVFAAPRAERFQYANWRAGFGSAAPTPRLVAATAVSSGDTTPARSGQTESKPEAAAPKLSAEKEEEGEAAEWVAQVEAGVLITFVPSAHDGNDLKKIRFSQKMFNKCQAQQWWAENYDKVMELYNVQRLNRETDPLLSPPKSEHESSTEHSPVTPLNKEQLPRKSSSSDSADHKSACDGHHGNYKHQYGCQSQNPEVLTPTPNLSMAPSARTSSSSPKESDRSGELSASSSGNSSSHEREWVEEDEAGVYITVRSLPGGLRELHRVRFSRVVFSEIHARVWWEENRVRIQEQYL